LSKDDLQHLQHFELQQCPHFCCKSAHLHAQPQRLAALLAIADKVLQVLQVVTQTSPQAVSHWFFACCKSAATRLDGARPQAISRSFLFDFKSAATRLTSY
jgi:hypothetical protein